MGERVVIRPPLLKAILSIIPNAVSYFSLPVRPFGPANSAGDRETVTEQHLKAAQSLGVSRPRKVLLSSVQPPERHRNGLTPELRAVIRR
jgi:hypothetical protein